MKNLLLLLVSINFQIVLGQNVIEKIKPVNFDMNAELFASLDTSLIGNIAKLENGLKNSTDNFDKHMIYQYLGYFYTAANQDLKCLNMWDSLNQAGIIMPFELTGEPFPDYIAKYVDNEQFLKFMTKNENLKNEATKTSSTEYFVSLPMNYDSTKSYPLIIILHGGIGNYYDTYSNWESKIMTEKFISVYPQGREIYGSYSRRYGVTGIKDIIEVYEQVKQKYSVNSEQIILAGQSRGGYLSIKLSYESIPVKGLLLAFPVKPEDFDIKKADLLKKRNTGVVMFCGEKDLSFITGQKELAAIMDSVNLTNKCYFHPDLGHEFPKDFSEQLDNGLIFLSKPK
jgi:predicted esterase